MNSIGNNVFINQNAPVVSSIIGANLNLVTTQSAISFQIFADKQRLIRRAKKISKTSTIDSSVEHTKQTQRDLHLSTKEYERIFMQASSIPLHTKEERLSEISDEKIEKYKDSVDNSNTSHLKNIKI